MKVENRLWGEEYMEEYKSGPGDEGEVGEKNL